MSNNKIEILHFVPIASALTCLESNIRYINKVTTLTNKDKLIVGNYKHCAFNRILSDVNFLRGVITDLWKDLYGWIPGVEFLIDISKDYQLQEDNIFSYPIAWHLIKGNYEDYDTISRFTNDKPLIAMIGNPLINICERIGDMYNDALNALLNITDEQQRMAILGRIIRFCNGIRALKGNIFAGDDSELDNSLVEDLKTAYKSASIVQKANIRRAIEKITKSELLKEDVVKEVTRAYDTVKDSAQFTHYDPNKDTVTMSMGPTQSFTVSAEELSKARSK